MVLRPAEIAVIILTFAEYSIQPFHNALGLKDMDDHDKSRIIKLVALLALGMFTLKKHCHCSWLSTLKLFRVNNLYKFGQRKIVCKNQQRLWRLQGFCMFDCNLRRNL